MLTFFIIFGVVVADQFSKFFVRLFMEVGESVTFIPGVMNLTYVENSGAAFGILGGARWVFILISTAAIAGILWFLKRHKNRHLLLTLALSFITGGGIGNMIDRVFITNAEGRHVVTDFFETVFVKFAVFNVADSFITIGAVLLSVYVLFLEHKITKKAAETPACEGADTKPNQKTEFDFTGKTTGEEDPVKDRQNEIEAENAKKFSKKI